VSDKIDVFIANNYACGGWLFIPRQAVHAVGQLAAVRSERAKRVFITAAAIKHDGKIYQGERHGQIMQKIWNEEGLFKIMAEDQGFVTNHGQFVNRFQAGAIAYRAGQTKDRHQELLSEHVW
jgi:hypothetical protein